MLGIFSLSSSCLWGLYGGLQPLLVLVYNISCLVFPPFLSAVCGACMVDCSRFWSWYIISHAWYFSLSSSCLWGLYGGLQPLLVLVYNISCLVFPPFLPAVCGACMVDCSRFWFWYIISHAWYSLPFFQLSVGPVWWTAAASGSGK